MQKYGPSLYSYLKRNEFRGFLMTDIQNIIKQLLSGVSFLHKYEIFHSHPRKALVLNLHILHEHFIN